VRSVGLYRGLIARVRDWRSLRRALFAASDYLTAPSRSLLTGIDPAGFLDARLRDGDQDDPVLAAWLTETNPTTTAGSSGGIPLGKA
jgi:hypothetical protein